MTRRQETLPGQTLTLTQAAMAENMAKTNSPNEDFNEAYNKWSAGGWGMIMTGNVQVDIDHLGNFMDPAFQGENATSKEIHMESWKKYAAASQKHGSPTIVQISHPGKQSLRGAGRRGLFASTMAPSAIPLTLGTGLLDSAVTSLAFPKPREMTPKDIERVIRLFVDTARMVADSGFSGIELHAAHGYLLGKDTSVPILCTHLLISCIDQFMNAKVCGTDALSHVY